MVKEQYNNQNMNVWLKIVLGKIMNEKDVERRTREHREEVGESFFNISDSELDKLCKLLREPKLSAHGLEKLLNLNVSNINFMYKHCIIGNDIIFRDLLISLIISDIKSPNSEYLNVWHDWLLNEKLELGGEFLSAPSLIARAIDILELKEVEGVMVAKVESLRLKNAMKESDGNLINKKLSAL